MKTCIELNLQHIGKHPFQCFHSEIYSAIRVHGDTQIERNIAVDKTKPNGFGRK